MSASNTTRTYAWDFETRLASVSRPDGAKVAFLYDPFSRRIQKTTPSGVTIYAYDGSNIQEELDNAGNVKKRFTYGPGIDEPLVLQHQSGTFFYEADALGSVTSLTDATGTVAATYTYDSFGNLTNSTGSAPNRFRYTGREWDGDTGLYYYRARYYDPTIGRFISEDPSGFRGGINFYSYVTGNPVRFVDPSGLAVTIYINNRQYSSTGNSVQGDIAVYSDQTPSTFSGYTMENANAGDDGSKPPIPMGTYDAFVRTDYDPNRIQLDDVPGYSGIQIHNGSYPFNFEGCIGAGTSQSTDFLGGTQNAMNQIDNIINADGSGNITVVVGPIGPLMPSHMNTAPMVPSH